MSSVLNRCVSACGGSDWGRRGKRLRRGVSGATGGTMTTAKATSFGLSLDKKGTTSSVTAGVTPLQTNASSVDAFYSGFGLLS